MGHGTGESSGLPLTEGVGITTLALPQLEPTTLLQLAVAHAITSWYTSELANPLRVLLALAKSVKPAYLRTVLPPESD